MDLSKFSRDIFRFLAYRVSYEKSKGFQVKTITVPPDKSLSHRALILASLAEGVSEIKNVLMSEDVKATVRILRQLGVKIEMGDIFQQFQCDVHGVGLNGYKSTDEILDCGNSGTTMRLMLGVLAGQGIAAKLTGDDSLNRRPMDRVIEPLRKMGANIDIVFENGRRVIVLSPHAGLKPLDYKLPVASAQVKSALLLAGLTAGIEVKLEEPMPTRNHTEILLKGQGIDIVTDPCRGRVSLPRVQSLRPYKFTIPGDFSSAAFFIVFALLRAKGTQSPLQIKNVGLNPTRTGLLDVLRRMGADVGANLCIRPNQMDEKMGDLLIKPSQLKNTTVAPHEIPCLIDEIPILALAASFAEGEFVLSGAEELRVKECDRIHAICTELKKLGVDITEKRDGFVIRGKPIENHRDPRGGCFSSYGDHRIAMMLVIAVKILGHDLTIDDTDCIATSFPGFFNLLEKYEGEIETTEVFDK